jgi:small subunit ribosomal protein S6
MPLYEHVYLARPDVSAQQVEALNEQFKGVIEQNGGTVGKVEYWGLKSVSFRMRKNRKAHYSLMNIEAPPAAVAEMERQMRINEDILRFLTIRVDAHEEGPSAMLQRRERDERRDRERGDRFGDRGDRFGDRGDRGERFGRREREERREEQPSQET